MEQRKYDEGFTWRPQVAEIASRTPIEILYITPLQFSLTEGTSLSVLNRQDLSSHPLGYDQITALFNGHNDKAIKRKPQL